MIQKQKLGKNFPFFFWFNYGFPWLKKKKNIILLSPFLILFQLSRHYFYEALFNFLYNFIYLQINFSSICDTYISLGKES